jgi:phosphoribosylglycinamide formyltransferase-1
VKIAVFASRQGTNFSAIARAVKKGRIKAELAVLVCDRPKAAVVARAKRAGVKVALVRNEEEILAVLAENKIDLIVLAGFMRILGPQLVGEYKHRILNIHPALLPSFKGAHGIADAFNYGVKLTGVTVHFVDEEMDHGPIILQAPLRVEQSDSLESLEKKIHKVEHKLYPQAVKLFVEGRLKIEGRKVVISTALLN